MSADDEDEGSLVRRILTNELLWVAVAAVGILILALFMATQ